MKKIVHIITGLGSGGAEHMLYKFLKYSERGKYYHKVISLTDEGVYGKKISDLGIDIYCLKLSMKNLVSSLLKSIKISQNCDVISTWLYHADIFGFLVGKIILRKKLIWNIRHSNLEKEANKNTTLKIIKINTILSKYVDIITYNSERALKVHLEKGYIGKKSVVIPNGFELDKYKFSLDDREKIRKKLNIIDEKVLITVGRWDIQKDYYTLLKTLKRLKKCNLQFKMIMVGTNLDYSNMELNNLIEDYELKNNILLLGRQDNISELLSSADIYISSSLGESFSNAIGEAMACELTCVVTDVGDSRKIVGNTGGVVEPGNDVSLAEEIKNRLLKQPIRSEEARERIKSNYEIVVVVQKIESEIDNIF